MTTEHSGVTVTGPLEVLPVTLHLNGRRIETEVEARTSLLDFVRQNGATGTHAGCEHGVCGACTVLVDGRTVRSCLLFAVQVVGQQVLTVEGLAPGGDVLHPLQRAFHEHHALQCGFCTPGMLLTALELLQDNPAPTEVEVRRGLAGNLCMCTGYVNIVRAVLAAAEGNAAQIPASTGAETAESPPGAVPRTPTGREIA